jgi:nitrite reductase/ring-hydroxylating ferredoxin subunit
MERRTFLSLLAWGLTASAAGLFGLVGAAVLGSPLRRGSQKRWIAAAEESALGESFRPVLLQYETCDGWRRVVRREVLFLRAGADGSAEALSASCTHLGCSVRWSEGESRFRCPCHGGVFDAEGRVLAGPPPAPLRRCPLRISEGTVYVEAG